MANKKIEPKPDPMKCEKCGAQMVGPDTEMMLHCPNCGHSKVAK